MSKFKILEVKQNMELSTAIEEINNEIKNMKIGPLGIWSLQNINESFKNYLYDYKESNGKYILENSFFLVTGKNITLYYFGEYEREEIFDAFLSKEKEGLFFVKFVEEYKQLYENYMISVIDGKLKEKGQNE